MRDRELLRAARDLAPALEGAVSGSVVHRTALDPDALWTFDRQTGLGAVLENAVQSRQGDPMPPPFQLLEQFATTNGRGGGPEDGE